MPLPDDDLAVRLAALLKELLEQEEYSAGGAREQRRAKLRQLINDREELLDDERKLNALFALFQNYIGTLPEDKRPKHRVQTFRLYAEWESDLKSELGDWRIELSQLDTQTVDAGLVIDSAKHKIRQLFRRAVQVAGRVPPEITPPDDPSPEVRVFLKFKIAAAEADFYDAKRIVVLGDSGAAVAAKKYEEIYNQQEQLVADGTLVVAGPDKYRFTSDCPFRSPSQAAGVVTGYPANGWRVWKDADGRSLSAVTGRV